MERIKISDLPSEERPYEKCRALGPGALSDAELLAVILRTGSRTANSLELASQVLALSRPGDGLAGLSAKSLSDFMKLEGVGLVKGLQLVCIGELSKRIWKRRRREEMEPFNHPQAAAGYLMEDMRHLDHEEIRGLFLDTKNRLIKDCLLSKGTINASALSPREVLIAALGCQAASFILAHNHPSGDPSPSKDDAALTGRISQAAGLVGIPLVDHIIIGDLRYFSFREENIL